MDGPLGPEAKLLQGLKSRPPEAIRPKKRGLAAQHQVLYPVFP